jgi:hypothetical protein
VKLLRAFACFACIAAYVVPTVAYSQAITNAPLHRYFMAGAVRLRIDKIETYPGSAVSSVPVLEGQGLSGSGFVVVTATAQNPSSSQEIAIPHMEVGFELKDGSQMNESAPDLMNLPGTRAAAPTSLHPKQHVQFSWVISDWTGSPPTKLLLKVWNDSGYPGFWYRILLRPSDVSKHT